MFRSLLLVFAIAVQQSTSAAVRKPYDDCVCGRPKFAPRQNVTDLRITGGQEAIPHSHPWIVYLEYGSNKCGAVILPTHKKNSSDVLATAAHCVRDLKTEDLDKVKVLAGAHDLGKTDEEGRQYGKIVAVVLAEGGVQNDFALLKLASPLTFTDYISAPCLSSTRYLPPRTRCLVGGWGAIRGGVSEQTDLTKVPELVMTQVLMETTVVRHSDAFCEDPSVMGSSYNSKVHICAGQTEGVKGVNNCDSGGPLVCKEHDHWTLLGVVKGRCFRHASRPSLFMKVSSFAEMIRRETGIKDWYI